MSMKEKREVPEDITQKTAKEKSNVDKTQANERMKQYDLNGRELSQEKRREEKR